VQRDEIEQGDDGDGSDDDGEKNVTHGVVILKIHGQPSCEKFLPWVECQRSVEKGGWERRVLIAM
jgi:hypothetical protein